jgi:nitroreductase
MRKLKELLKCGVLGVVRQMRLAADGISRNYQYDEDLFRRSARPRANGTSSQAIASGGLGYSKANLKALLTMEYHRIEKALCLPSPRFGFGIDVIDRLMDLTDIYTKKFGEDVVVYSAINAVKAYSEFHIDNTDTIARELNDKISLFLTSTKCNLNLVSHVEKMKSDVLGYSTIEYSEFCKSRHSIRDYSPDPVPVDLILAAVVDAQTTPSVCNRQASRVIAVRDPVLVDQVLKLQNGNRGFGDYVTNLFVVYYDLSSFVSVGERNQGWIDSGMFSMNLVLALHSRGLGTCCLNWSVDSTRDRELVRLLKLPESSRIVMLISCGNLKETFRVAGSAKLPLNEVLTVV